MPTPSEFVTSDLDLAATIIANNSLEFSAVRSAPGNTKDKLFVFQDHDEVGSRLLADFISGRTEGNIPRFIQTKGQLLTAVRRLGVQGELTFTRTR
jgi:hypothetical protein